MTVETMLRVASLTYSAVDMKLCIAIAGTVGEEKAPHALRSIDLVHGRAHFHVRFNVCDQRLDDHEAKGGHGLRQLLLHIMRNLLLCLQHRVDVIACQRHS